MSFRRSIGGRPISNIPRPASGLVAPGSMHHRNGSSPSGAGGGGSSLSSSSGSMAHETYHFPILKPQAIVSCMTDVQVPCAEEDLARPQPQKMLIVYEAFMDVATGSPKDDCYLDDIHEMNVATSPEFVVDSVRFYIFLNQLTNLMYEVGISDFTSRDVLKPEPERVRRILSAVINFAKFREDRQPSFFQELRKTDALVEMIAAGEQDHEQMILDLEAIKQQKQADMPRIEELKTANGSLATELDEYKKLDAELNKQLAEAGALRKALSERNQELNDAIDRSTKELTDIQAQRVDVPETLEQELAQIPESIQTLVQQVDQHRRLIQTRHAAVEKIEAVPKELYTVQELMSGTVRLMENYQEQASEVESIRSEIENRKLDSSTLTSKVDQTERLVRMTEDKLRTVRESTQQKRAVYEQETLEQDRVGQEAEENLLSSRQLLEEKRKRASEIWQAEERHATEVTALMDQLKHQFELYSTEILQAVRLP